MEKEKSTLQLFGTSFIEIIANQVKTFDECLISLKEEKDFRIKRFKEIIDVYPEGGPIVGIYSALLHANSDALLVIACDMPMFKYKLAEYMMRYLHLEYDAFIIKTDDNKIHPLCGIYKKEVLPIFEEMILQKVFCMRLAIKNIKCYYIRLDSNSEFNKCVINVNTRSEYIQLKSQFEKPSKNV